MTGKDRLLRALTACLLALASTSDAVEPLLRSLQEKTGIIALQDSLDARGEKPGAGQRIAVIDDGFCLRHRGLARLRTELADGWDFFRSSAAVWDTLPRLSHGSATLGVIASDWDSLPGIAPAADFMLYRTEVDSFERLDEESWLAAAITRAADSGATVISISLGYRFFIDSVGELPWSDFNGRTLASSIAATAAASKAVVVVAMGNDGSATNADGSWSPTLGAPADADGILSVAAVDSTGKRCSFSSTGNTSDGRIKPDVAAYGCPYPVLDASDTAAWIDYYGTSFATPFVAGMAALVRQFHPAWTPAEVISALKASGSQADRPDSLLGWGLPNLRAEVISSGITPPERLASAHPWSLRGDILHCHTDLGTGLLSLHDLSGRTLLSRTITARRGTGVSLPGNARGLLLLRFESSSGTVSERLLRP